MALYWPIICILLAKPCGKVQPFPRPDRPLNLLLDMQPPLATNLPFGEVCGYRCVLLSA
jgi:hypothetical protein